MADVALHLPENYNRSTLANADFHLGNVDFGLFKLSDPEAKWQFAWVDPNWRQDIDSNRQRGYQWVNVAEWAVRENGDEIPFAEYGRFEVESQNRVYYNGQHLMARPAELYYKEEKRRLGEAEEQDPAESAKALADRYGIPVEDTRPANVVRKGRKH